MILTLPNRTKAFVPLPAGQLKNELFQSQRLDELVLPDFNAVRERPSPLCVDISDRNYAGGPYGRELREGFGIPIAGE